MRLVHFESLSAAKNLKMFPSSTLLSLLFLLLSTTLASPVRRAPNIPVLSLASTINSVPAGKTVADIDRARAAALLKNASAKKIGKRVDGPVIATDITVSYTASVGVGAPPTQCELLASLPATSLGPYVFC